MSLLYFHARSRTSPGLGVCEQQPKVHSCDCSKNGQSTSGQGSRDIVLRGLETAPGLCPPTAQASTPSGGLVVGRGDCFRVEQRHRPWARQRPLAIAAAGRAALGAGYGRTCRREPPCGGRSAVAGGSAKASSRRSAATRRGPWAGGGRQGRRTWARVGGRQGRRTRPAGVRGRRVGQCAR